MRVGVIRWGTVAVASVVMMHGATALAAPGDYTWDGTASGASGWGTALNWVGDSAPSGTVGMLTFPDLTSSACSGTSNAHACYNASNDIPGLSAYGLNIGSDGGYTFSGDGITIGAGGLTVDAPSDYSDPPEFELPITLGAPQTWTIDGSAVILGGDVSGDQALALDFSHDSSFDPWSDVEVGAVTATGGGGFYLDGDTSVNSTDGGSIGVANGAGIEADQTNNAVGPVSVGSHGWLSVGGIDDGGGQLAVNGGVSFAANSELDLAVDAPGTTAGVDYSQLSATGTINLNGATLDVSQGIDVDGSCDDLEPGNALTLLSGPISGTFSNYGNGATVDIVDDCNNADQDASGTLTYSANAVTLTIDGAGDTGDVPFELVQPSISGTAQEGKTLQVDPGSWQGATSFTYSWWQCNTVTCTQIPGAASQAFVPTSAQLGDQIYAYVTAVGHGGDNADYTDNTAAVTAEPVPASTAAPTVTGGTTVGDVLTASTGSWSNSPTSYGYQWERCSSTGSDCGPISGAGTGTYTLTGDDAGSTIEVQLTATNYGGTGSAASSTPTALITTRTTVVTPPTSPVVPASVTPQVSLTSIGSALKRLLTPTGRDALAKELLKLHGYTFSFSAPAAGQLTLIWTATIKHRTVTLARAVVNISAAHTVKFKLVLTSQGKRDLKRYPGLKVKAQAGFKVAGLGQIDASGRFTLAGKVGAAISRHQLAVLRHPGVRSKLGLPIRS